MTGWEEIEAATAPRISSGEGFFVVGEDQRVTAWSSGMAAILGVDEADAIGVRCSELMQRLESRDPLPCRDDCNPLEAVAGGAPSACVLRRDQGLGAWSLLHEHLTTGNGEAVLHRLRDASLDVIAVRFLSRLVEAIQEDVTDLRQAGEKAHQHNVELTPRESEVLQLMGEGLDTRTVGRRLGISYYTARNYIQNVLTKLNAHNRVEAVVTAQRLGLLRKNGSL